MTLVYIHVAVSTSRRARLSFSRHEFGRESREGASREGDTLLSCRRHFGLCFLRTVKPREKRRPLRNPHLSRQDIAALIKLATKIKH